MPDDDRFPRRLTARWKKVLWCLKRQDPAEQVADAVARALAGTLRDTHGVPQIEVIAAQMQQAAMVQHGAQSRVPNSLRARSLTLSRMGHPPSCSPEALTRQRAWRLIWPMARLSRSAARPTAGCGTSSGRFWTACELCPGATACR
jgi:hypothetical protein